MNVQPTVRAIERLILPEHLGFRRGLRCALEGLAFIFARPHLLVLCVTPWLINLLVLLPLTWLLLKVLVFDWAMGRLPGSQEWWGVAVQITAGIVLALLLAVFGMLVFLGGALILGAPFHDKVGELIERERLRGRPELLAPAIPFWQGVFHAVLEAVRRITVGLPFLLLTIIVSIVPMVGPLIALSLQVAFAASFLTLDAFSMPMDRRGLGMGRKLGWIGSNIPFAVGFGLPFMAIPCAVFLTPPIAAASASLIYCEHLLKGAAGGGEVAPSPGPGPTSGSDEP